MKVGKSGAKADNMLGVKKKAPETKEAKKNVKMELVELLDSGKKAFDPLRGSKDGEIHGIHIQSLADALLIPSFSADTHLTTTKVRAYLCFSPLIHFLNPGGFIMEIRVNSMQRFILYSVEEKAPQTEEAKKAAKDFFKSKRPASAFYLSSPGKDPNKPKRSASSFFVFMEEFRKQFEENIHTINLRPLLGCLYKRVAAGASEEEESYKSMSEVDEEDEDDD
ncbi:hypothetical protein HAX54_052191 [Datura stramonium]|uniref:HMG box domain-containing protein n=1 Tax=Datura stramonium TaxID=4076 RepID=A0ABS8WS38_DATST|nr:hypothetical protein [Datura stramonium]